MNEPGSRIEELKRQGWSEQFVANEPRLSEAVDLYRESGYEVHLEPLPEAPACETCSGEKGSTGCRVCYEGVEDQYKIIFTRKLDEKK